MTWWRQIRFAHWSPLALKRALRPAVVMPSVFAFGGQVVGNPQTATFAAFAAFALLLFVEFPGNRQSRAYAHLFLLVFDAGLIALGSIVASPGWLAVVAMAAVAFAVLFAGVVSSTIAAAGRAALLMFILPVMLPGGPATIGWRLLGLAIAGAVAVPVALLLWPLQDQNLLRVRAAAACRALAATLAPERPPPGVDHRAAMSRAMQDLRVAFRASASRPVALSTGSRMLIGLVDELEWLTTTVANAGADEPETWPKKGRELRARAADVLTACGRVLEHDGRGPDQVCRTDLDHRMAALDAARTGIAAATLDELRESAATGPAGDGGPRSTAPGEFDRPLYAAHELGYVVALTAATVATIAAADSRRWLDRLLGRPPRGLADGEIGAAERLAVGHFDRHSVWLQTSIRGAVGLAVAVLIARLSGQQEGFWIVLGAMSVLRSNALSTGATALRAVIGTAAGFIIGGALVAVIGTSPAVLWPLLPVAIFVAALTPALISFVAGQAAFSVVVIILFNILAPAGWKIGVLRVEDVALGCAASVLAGVLFWPRGAGAALGAAMSEAYEAGADYLSAAINHLTGGLDRRPPQAAAEASGLRLDDALRQYLAERGAKNIDLEAITALANGATRLRLAATAVLRLSPAPADPGDGLAEPIAVLIDQAERVTGWYRTLGAMLDGTGVSLPEPGAAMSEQPFLDVVLPKVAACGDRSRADRAERLLWSGQYLGDVGRARAELVKPAGQVAARRRLVPAA